MEEKEEGLSIGEIFHVIFIKKWLLLAVTLVVAIIGMVFVQFIYNPGSVEYETTFQVKFPDNYTTSNDERFYPDGQEFLYQEFISLENLQKAKDKDESFKSIDIEKMKYKNDISIQEYEITINEQPVKMQIYSIYILKKYFATEQQAVNFFDALIHVPRDIIIEKSESIEHDKHLKQFNLVKDYDSKVNSLIDQKENIINQYNELISKYSTAQAILLEGGNKLSISEALSEVESYFTRYDLKGLLVEIEENGYVNPSDTEYYVTIENNKASLVREKTINEAKIVNLNEQYKKMIELSGNQTIIIQDIMASINELTSRNAEIDYTINNVYDKILNNRDIHNNDSVYQEKLKSFDERLTAHYNKLLEFTETYKKFSVNSYKENTKILVSAGSVITSAGGFNVILALAVFLVVGFVVGCGVNLCLDMPAYLKNKKNEENEKEEVNE